MMRNVCVTCTLLVLAALTPAAMAQTITGDLVVNIADPSGAVVMGAKLTLTDVRIQVGQRARVDIRMAVGQLTESVTVSAAGVTLARRMQLGLKLMG